MSAGLAARLAGLAGSVAVPGARAVVRRGGKSGSMLCSKTEDGPCGQGSAVAVAQQPKLGVWHSRLRVVSVNSVGHSRSKQLLSIASGNTHSALQLVSD